MNPTEHLLSLRERTLSRLLLDRSSPMQPVPTGEAPRRPPMEGIRAVVFDLYGTLFISRSGDLSLTGHDDPEDALRNALEQAGVASLPANANLSERFLGTIRNHQDKRRKAGIEYPEVDIRLVWRDFLEGLAADGLHRPPPDEETLLRLAVDYECRINPVWPMPGLRDTLSQLQHAGLTLGIVSNAQFLTPLMFPALLGASPETLGFTADCCIYSFQEGEAKPSVRLFERLLARLSEHRIKPAEVLYVGNDLRNDVWPAGRRGLRTALFAGDRRSLRWREDDPRVRHVQPDAVITELLQIPPMILSHSRSTEGRSLQPSSPDP